ncbi:hypothetical protein [Massilia sp. ST3]|uniref:SMODS-associated NUDIX domain-containing protein n=1 Tax=Massilia sp. ST3 TaxID=2824903 RepID=UPI001B827658|nr:hypothetical protein [Massilia sp. ST3]MBQ5946269.1 hypothetical protein [Massilia sp. ST3]
MRFDSKHAPAERQRAKRLVLFVHGLGGKAKSTWGGFETLLKNDPELKEVDVSYFSYPSFLLRVPIFGTRYPGVPTLAQALATQIKHRFSAYQDITLVCHSLGGLIGKQYLIDCMEAEEHSQVSSILLYAVPNNGAALAELASCISWRHAQLRHLCRESDLVRNIGKSWERMRVESKVKVCYVLAALDKVVPEHSARMTWSNSNVEVLADRGHINVVKPSGKDDLSYLILRNSILQAGATPTAAPAPAPPAEKPSKFTQSSVPQAVAKYDENDEHAEVRVVASVSLRIQRAGKYLLIRNVHRPESFAPIGGVYKTRPGAKKVLDQFNFRVNAVDDEMGDDIRGFITQNSLQKFREWFEGGSLRESAEQCAYREFREETLEVGLDIPSIEHLHFRHIRSVTEGPEPIKAENYCQFRIFEVYDLDESAIADGVVETLYQASLQSRDLIWVDADEIRRGRARNRQLIAPHAAYFLGKTRYRDHDPAI